MSAAHSSIRPLFDAAFAHHLDGRLAEADQLYRTILAAVPGHAGALHLLGVSLHQIGRQTEATPLMRRALRFHPDDFAIWSNLGDALRADNEVEEAVAALKRAVILHPSHANAIHNLGLVLQHLGRDAASHRQLDRAVTLDPHNATFFYTLVSQTRLTDPADPRLASMEKLARSLPETALNDLTSLHFALGVSFKDLNRGDRALEHFILANRFKRRMLGYDEAGTLAFLDRIAQVYPAERFAGLPVRDPMGTGPIFVVGMPRSGTSLVEQILASHSEIFGAGELTLLEQTVIRHLPPGGSILSLPDLPPADLHRIGDAYRAALRARAPGAARIVDKLPLNFLRCGAIALMLPDARIVHVRRDPVDTCLSCFSNHFAGGHAYTQELGDLGRFYRAYERLMDHWRRVLPPGIMIELTYEEIVADLEGEMRPVFGLCGLAWEDACSHFHRTRRAVLTASQSQVRQPLFTSRTTSWRPSNALLQPLLDALAGKA